MQNKTRGFYQLLSDQNIVNDVNMILQQVSDRLDKIEGIRGTAEIESDLNVAGSANISGNASVAGDTSLTGDLSINGDITSSGTVTSVTIIVNQSTVTGDQDVTGNQVISGDQSVVGTLTAPRLSVTYDAVMCGHFSIHAIDEADEPVTETVQWHGNGLCTGNMNVGNDLYCAGDIQSNNIYPGNFIGIIAIWSGAIVDIPTGWSLCDGTNGTPDLTDKFVLGAGSTWNPGDTGGATTDTSGTPSSTTVVNTAGSGSTGPVASETHTHEVNILPPYYSLAFIMFTG